MAAVVHFYAACSEPRNPSTSDFSCSDCEDSRFAASCSRAVAPLLGGVIDADDALVDIFGAVSCLLQIAGNSAPRVSKDMVDLAAHILDTKAWKFDPHKLKDKYETALTALVKRKAAGKTIEVPDEKEEESNVIDLMDALKQSLGRKKAATSPPKGRKRASALRGRKRTAA